MSLNLGAISYNSNLLILLDLAVHLDNDYLQHEAPVLPTATSLLSADISTCNAESRLSGLERNYTTFQVNHKKIFKLENLDKTHAYFSTVLYDLVEDSFYDRKESF